jgi:hypothetical protein
MECQFRGASGAIPTALFHVKHPGSPIPFHVKHGTAGIFCLLAIHQASPKGRTQWRILGVAKTRVARP